MGFPGRQSSHMMTLMACGPRDQDLLRGWQAGGTRVCVSRPHGISQGRCAVKGECGCGATASKIQVTPPTDALCLCTELHGHGQLSHVLGPRDVTLRGQCVRVQRPHVVLSRLWCDQSPWEPGLLPGAPPTCTQREL